LSKRKIILIILVILLLSNAVIYYINKINVNDRIHLILDDNLEKLDIHYKLQLSHQTTISDSFYKMLMNKKGFIELFKKVNNSSLEDKKLLRDQLKNLIVNDYNIMKNSGVLQFQFVFPDNISFLRMHKPTKFGDNLANVRSDFVFSNRTKKISRGLVSGKTIHGFRNVYPIFSKKGEHLGAVDISFASENFQNELTKISGVHAHFLINKSVFKTIDEKNQDFMHSYTQSSEHTDYIMSLTKTHNKQVCIIDNTRKLSHLKEEIIINMDSGGKFSFFTRTGTKDIEVISFLPIKGFNSNTTMGWLVSYSNNKFVAETLRTGQLIVIFSSLVLSLIAFFIYQQIAAEMRIKKEHTLLDDVINTSEDMIFVTNFQTISFSNKKFKSYSSIDHVSDIIDVTSHFVTMNGYLHKDLLNEQETFNELISRTPKEDRVVCLIDKTMNPKAFAISIVESSYTKDDYLVTLTDITKIKEKELQISNKAFYDGLTGVYNRNKFDELIAIELKRDKRYKNNLSIAIVDIDHFKIFNDKYGHLIGDEVLIMIAKYLDDNVRDTDIFARWGGEEFVILFPETNAKNAETVCEKLRLGIMKLEHAIAGNVTASFGVTQCTDNDVIDSLFKRCDDALYEAKENGRNKVVIG